MIKHYLKNKIQGKLNEHNMLSTG